MKFLGRNFQRVVYDRVNDKLHSENPYGQLSPFFINVAKMILANVVNGNALIGIINQASGVQINSSQVDGSGVVYIPYANVAAIPGSPGEGDRIEVMDSTGIESFTPLTGVPPGFVGSNQVKVRLIYTSGTWTWAGSVPVDPTAYYLLRSELSSAVNSTSTTTPANVAGVKTAYDAAQNALTNANSAVSTANTASANATAAVNTANSAAASVNNRLPLAGGTMTGNIVFNNGQPITNLKFTTSGTDPVGEGGASYSFDRTLLGRLADLPSVLDFIPETEHAAIRQGTSTYDCTVAFKRAIRTHRRIFIPYGTYTISDTLNLTEEYSGLIGDPRMPFIYKSNPAAGPAIRITASGSGENEFIRVENLAIWHGTPSSNPRPAYPTTPSGSVAGLVVDGSASSVSPSVRRVLIQNMRVIGWPIGVYLGASVNTKLERVIVENHTVWSSNNSGLTSANKYIGFYFNCTPVLVGGISPQASIEVSHCIVNGGFAPTNVRAFGFFALGSDVRDIFMTNCETAGGDYGFFIENTGSDWNWDIHLIRPIADAFRISGVVFKGLNGPAAASLIGGYAVRSAGSVGYAALILESCSGVSVSGGFQALGYTSGDALDNGILLLNSVGNTIVGAMVVNCRYGISLEGSSLNVITGNIIGAGTPALEPLPVLSVGIRLFASGLFASNGNVINSNVIRGASALYPYPEGINIGPDCVGTQVVGNNIEAVTVSTPVVMSLPNDNQQRLETSLQMRGSKSIAADTSLTVQSTGGPQFYQGNDATAPHKFRDGSSTLISQILNNGSYVQISDASHKQQVQLLGPVLAALSGLEGKTFVMDNDQEQRRRMGLIAQDVQALFPFAVSDIGDGRLGLDYASLVAVLVNAVNELNTRLTALEDG